MPLGDSNYPQSEIGGMLKAERCRPDYEQMIEYQRKDKAMSEKLLNALFEYMDFHGIGSHIRPNSSESVIATFIGVLTCDVRRSMANIKRMIQELEKYDAEEERRKT